MAPVVNGASGTLNGARYDFFAGVLEDVVKHSEFLRKKLASWFWLKTIDLQIDAQIAFALPHHKSKLSAASHRDFDRTPVGGLNC